MNTHTQTHTPQHIQKHTGMYVHAKTTHKKHTHTHTTHTHTHTHTHTQRQGQEAVQFKYNAIFASTF